MPSRFHSLALVLAAMAATAAIGFGAGHCRKSGDAVWLPQYKSWSETPIAVKWERGYWDRHSESFEIAIDAVNRELGCEVFREASGAKHQTRILSADGEPCGGGQLATDADATAWLCPDGSTEIHISAPGTINCSARIVMHELGHVLGMGHFHSGIMREKTGCDDVMFFASDQKKALRARYCN